MNKKLEDEIVKPLRKGSLVKIGRGKKVYRVAKVLPARRKDHRLHYELAADANHPDAAKRVQDAFFFYPRIMLVRVKY